MVALCDKQAGTTTDTWRREQRAILPKRSGPNSARRPHWDDPLAPLRLQCKRRHHVGAVD